MPSCVHRPAARDAPRRKDARNARTLRQTLTSTAAIAVGAPLSSRSFPLAFALCDEPSERGDGAKI